MRTRRTEKRRRMKKLSRTMDRLESMQLVLNPETRKMEPVEGQALAVENLVQNRVVNS